MRRLKGGYWKLWHDVQGRFLVSLLIVCAVMWGALGPNNRRNIPTRCVAASPTAASWATLAAAADAQASRMKNPQERAQMVANNAIRNGLARSCRADEYPNFSHTYETIRWASGALEGLWTVMPFVLLFIGLLITVGAPFSGESMEAFTLTFSLPWSRQQWLINKALLATALLLFLTFLTYVVSAGMAYRATSYVPFGLAAQYSAFQRPPFDLVWRAVLGGMVGISLGVWSSMLTRNALAGAVAAGLVAIVLTQVDLGDVFPSALYRGAHLLELGNPGGVIAAVTIICGASVLAMYRLRHTDF